LMEDPCSLENQEILDFQKSYFERCLESAIANHFLKVTFIHGVGNGVLRENILSVLEKYEGIEVLDAPMQKYGVGAVEVRIPHNF
jgi:dsDNA-specific endonuclease/ATPase MutS2